MSQAYQLPMLFSADLHAKDGQAPETDWALKTIGISGLKCIDWFVSQGLDLSLLKMCAEELQKASSPIYKATWNLRGTKHGPSYILLRLSERRISENDCSLWPTAVESDHYYRQPSKTPAMTGNGTVCHQNAMGEQSFMRLSQVAQMYPTPAAQDAKNSSLPASQATRDTLPGAIIRWATLRASANRTSQKSKERSVPDSLCDQLSISSGSYLNPDWVELLMGFPVGWTSPVSRLTSGRPSTIMSRRGRSFHRVSIIDRASSR